MTGSVDRTAAAPSWSDRREADVGWTPITLRPDALTTSRFDDVARLLRGEHGRLLDFGCGPGQLVLALADSFDSLSGVDVSEQRIQVAQEALSRSSAATQAKSSFLRIEPAARLPFADASFDVVIACVVLEAVPDVFFAMDEISRVCRPGGCLVATVANVCYWKHAFGLLAGRIPLTWSPRQDMADWRVRGWQYGCLRYFSQSALGDLLRNAGFAPEAWSGSGKLARLRRWHLNLCGALTVRARRLGGDA